MYKTENHFENKFVLINHKSSTSDLIWSPVQHCFTGVVEKEYETRVA